MILDDRTNRESDRSLGFSIELSKPLHWKASDRTTSKPHGDDDVCRERLRFAGAGVPWTSVFLDRLAPYRRTDI